MRRIFDGAYVAVAAVVGFIFAQSPGAFAMDMKIVGDQLILSGKIVESDARFIEHALDNPAVKTVILRNATGSDTATGYRVGEMFRQRGVRTAVSGFCYSACSYMFLGGRTRYFTDDYPPEQTNIGFQGHYHDGFLDPNSAEQREARAWIVRYSDGRADPALVERWINLPTIQDLIHFYDPSLVNRRGASTFLCDGTQPNHGISSCEPVAATALDLGIVTSLDLMHGADFPQTQMTQLR